MKPLYPQQARAITLLRQALASGSRRPMLMAPTGFGKTRTAAEIINRALERKKRVVFTVPAISLVDQAVRDFYDEGIRDIGVIQADHPMTDPSKPVQIASIQTLARRMLPQADLVLIDEAHRVYEFVEKWMALDDWLDVPFIGLSATPWTRGLGRLYDRLIIAATTAELIEAGYLSQFRVFAPSHPDLSKVRTVAGDYHEGQLSAVMSEKALTADIVRTWLEKGEGRPTLCFAVDRVHAKTLQSQFASEGVACGYIDAMTPREEREVIRKQFAAGVLQVVANVGVLSTGVDWDVRCIILARPTKSEMLFCLDVETEVLTTAGWVGIDGMTTSHEVAMWADGAISFAPPLALLRRDRAPGERMVSVAGKVNNVRVTEGHRMLWSKTGRDFRLVSAGGLEGLRGFMPVSGNAPASLVMPDHVSADTLRKRGNCLAHKYRREGHDPVAARAKADEHQAHTLAHQPKAPAELTTDECAFIGFWMGDGTKGGGRYALVQSERYARIVAWVDDLLASIPLHHTRDSVASAKSQHRAVRWHLSTGRGGGDQRRANGLAPLLPYLDKAGSPLLWGLSKEQLKALLHGYWMADGNHGCGDVPSERGKQIFGTNRAAFDLLQAICACRGIRAGIHTAPARAANHKPLHTFHWHEQDAVQLVRDRLAFEADWRPERVWCVETETGTIITRRRGKVTVMGNCQIIGRGLRTAPGKSDCLILDHSDTTLRLGFVTDIHHDRLDDGTLGDKADAAGGEAESAKPKECPKCHYVRPPKVPTCPSCGHVAEKVSGVQVKEGELVEATARREAMIAEQVEFMAQLRRYQAIKSKPDTFCLAKFKAKFGEFPRDRRVTGAQAAPELTPQFRNWMTSQNIRYVRGKAKSGVAA